jgi:hypothetical protein
MFAREAAAQETARVQWVSRQQVQQTKTRLHPDQAAEKIAGRNPGLIEEPDISACSENRNAQSRGCDATGDWSSKSNGELAHALIRVFLTFGIGVGEQASNRKYENRAQAQAEPCRNEEAGDFANDYRGDEDKKKTKAAQPALRSAETKTHYRQEQEKGVDAQLDAHPTAQRN